MKKITSILIFVLCIALTGCTTGSFSAKNASEVNTSTKMSMTYDNFNGWKKAKLTVKEGETVEVQVSFVTQSGELEAYIAKDDDYVKSVYMGNNIQTSSFVVTISQPGEYTIKVTAKKHSGSYSFSWGE